MKKVIQIPTLNDSPHDFARLLAICKEAGRTEKKLKLNSANKALHRTVIPLRSITASELCR